MMMMIDDLRKMCKRSLYCSGHIIAHGCIHGARSCLFPAVMKNLCLSLLVQARKEADEQRMSWGVRSGPGPGPPRYAVQGTWSPWATVVLNFQKSMMIFFWFFLILRLRLMSLAPGHQRLSGFPDVSGLSGGWWSWRCLCLGCTCSWNDVGQGQVRRGL